MIFQQRRIIFLPCVLVVIATLTIYIVTLSPTINSFDSAEFTTAAYSLGIIHSPGYPLFLLIAHLTKFFPWGNPAYKINVLNAIYSALAVGFIFLSCFKITKSLLPSLFCALFLGFTYLFWSISVVTEVYAFDALLISCLIYWLVRLEEEPTIQNTYVLLFLYSLTLSHHLNAILFLPWIAIFIWAHRNDIKFQWKNIFVGSLIFFLPFIAYLYFPIRSLAHPQLDYIRSYFYVDLTTIKGILWMVSGRMFASDMFGRNILDGFSQFLLLWKSIWLNFLGIGLVMSIYGLWVYFKDHKILTISIIGCIFSTMIFFSFYDVIDNGEMIIPAFIFLTIPLSIGISNILSGRFIKYRLYRASITVVLCVLLATELSSDWGIVNRHNDWSAYNYSQQVMKGLQANAFVVSQWTTATPLEYAQIVEKERPDVDIFDRGLYVLGLQDSLPNNNIQDQIIIQKLVALVTTQAEIRPVYITEDDPLLHEYFCFVPEGLVYRVYLAGVPGEKCVGTKN